MANGATALKERVKKRRAENGIVYTLSVDAVYPWPNQPRKFFSKKSIASLGRSINQVGQKVPILVMSDTKRPGFYSIDDGERRWRACKLIGRRIIQAIILPEEGDDDRLVRSIVANFGREGHTPYEVAVVLRRIYETKKYSTGQIAAMFTRSDCWVYQHLSLTKLDARVVEMMSHDIPHESRLKFGIAILLTSLPQDLQFEIAKEITEKQMRMAIARHFVTVKAAAKNLKVGGMIKPERRRESLRSLLVGTASSLPPFLTAPDISLGKFLATFSERELAEIAKQAKTCQQGMDTLCQAIKTAQKKL